MKRPRKVNLISVHDYPREVYSAYWEIFVDDHTWDVRLISHDSHKLLEGCGGVAENEEEARRSSQTWVIERIENYRRDQPLVTMTDSHEQELRKSLDKAISEKLYGRADRIRGTLKAYGK